MISNIARVRSHNSAFVQLGSLARSASSVNCSLNIFLKSTPSPPLRRRLGGLLLGHCHHTLSVAKDKLTFCVGQGSNGSGDSFSELDIFGCHGITPFFDYALIIMGYVIIVKRIFHFFLT